MLIYLQVIETEEDKSKFEDIYREYRGLMYYIAYRRLHHEQDAEDAVHHAFMKIAENITAIDPVSPKTKQLVVTIVDNRVTDMLRMNGRHPTAEYNDEILSSLSSELHTDDLLTEAILKLPEQQRHVIWLKYYHGYSLREISKMLNAAHTAKKVRLSFRPTAPYSEERRRAASKAAKKNSVNGMGRSVHKNLL